MMIKEISFPIHATPVIFLVLIFSISFSFTFAYAESQVVEGHQVDYEIDGGTVTSMDLDPDFIELIINVNTNDNGVLQITIPRQLLDAKFDNIDDIFFVIVDGFDTEYVELTNGPDTRILLIPFFNGDTQIEIIGTDALGLGLEEFIEEFIEGDIEIPSWIKNNAGWWANGQIGDSDFVLGIQYLITNGIMTIPPTEAGSQTSQQIPDWIKNNAGWWANGLISDEEFVSGIKYLIEAGIMAI